MRSVPGQFPVAQTRMQRDIAAGILGDMHAIVHGVRSARRDQADVYNCASGPCIPLVDGIAVRIDLQGAVEMSSLFHGAVSVVFDHAAPEDGLAIVIGALEFEPGVVGVDRPAGEKVSYL